MPIRSSRCEWCTEVLGLLRNAGKLFAEVPLACSKPYLQRAVPAANKRDRSSNIRYQRCLRLESRADGISTLHGACRRGNLPQAACCSAARGEVQHRNRNENAPNPVGGARQTCIAIFSVLYRYFAPKAELRASAVGLILN